MELELQPMNHDCQSNKKKTKESLVLLLVFAALIFITKEDNSRQISIIYRKEKHKFFLLFCAIQQLNILTDVKPKKKYIKKY